MPFSCKLAVRPWVREGGFLCLAQEVCLPWCVAQYITGWCEVYVGAVRDATWVKACLHKASHHMSLPYACASMWTPELPIRMPGMLTQTLTPHYFRLFCSFFPSHRAFFFFFFFQKLLCLESRTFCGVQCLVLV